MSPCEKYVCTYSPMSDFGYTIWNFQMVEIIREFDCEREEDEDTWQWSFDGSYIAKKFRTETEKDGKTKIKEGLSVYELPSMELLKTKDGVKKSINVENINDWHWSPSKDIIAYTANLEREDEEYNAVPKVGFIKIPERRTIEARNVKNSESL